MLLLKRHLVELVKAGKKRQTIRLWSGKLLREGAISFTPGLGKMRITKVDELGSVEELTEADAVADGFASRKLLLEEIHKIYGKRLPAGKRVFRIGFEWPVGDGRSQEPEGRSQMRAGSIDGGKERGALGKKLTEPRRHEVTKGRVEPRNAKLETRNVKPLVGDQGESGGKSLVSKRVGGEGAKGEARGIVGTKREKRVLVGETSEVRRKVRGKREALRDFILAQAPRAGK